MLGSKGLPWIFQRLPGKNFWSPIFSWSGVPPWIRLCLSFSVPLKWRRLMGLTAALLCDVFDVMWHRKQAHKQRNPPEPRDEFQLSVAQLWSLAHQHGAAKHRVVLWSTKWNRCDAMATRLDFCAESSATRNLLLERPCNANAMFCATTSQHSSMKMSSRHQIYRDEEHQEKSSTFFHSPWASCRNNYDCSRIDGSPRCVSPQIGKTLRTLAATCGLRTRLNPLIANSNVPRCWQITREIDNDGNDVFFCHIRFLWTNRLRSALTTVPSVLRHVMWESPSCVQLSYHQALAMSRRIG